MAEKLLVELQDDKGNIFYLHTSSAAVFCADGKTVQEKIGTVKGRITTKENLKLVTEANYLPEAKAVKDYFDELNGKYTVDIVRLGLGDIIGYGIKTGSVSCAKSGYTPIGIVGYATIGTSGESVKVNIGNLFIDNGKVECAVFNISSTTVTGYYINVRVLYSKNL